MAVIIRRNKPEPAPVTIKRRITPATEDTHSERRTGEGWVHIPGFPPDRTKRAYHLLNIDGTDFAFLWNPNGRLGEEWFTGRHSYSPSVMKIHDYRGECVLVYRTPSTPADDVRFIRRKNK